MKRCKRPPVISCINRFVVIRYLNQAAPRSNGNAFSGHAFDLMGISPLPGSLRGALLCCDGSRRSSSLQRSALGLDASTFNASACHRLRDGCAIPPGLPTEGFRPAHSGLPGFSRQQRGRNGCAVHFNFQRTIEGKNTPSLFMPKNEGVERICF